MKHLLIVGRPGVGKTSMMKRLIQAVRRFPIDGFITEELREGGQRVGFWLSPLDGRQVLLAHRRMEHGHRVGPYRVNVDVLEQTVVPVVERGIQHAFLMFLDELGAMELCSRRVTEIVQYAFDRGPSIVATAGIHSIPFLTQLKRRKDVELVPLSTSNRRPVEEELVARLRALCDEDESIRQLHGHADRICQMIVSGDVPQIDIEIQQHALRETVAQLFPEKQHLYQLIFESRFRRLWQQFRHG